MTRYFYPSSRSHHAYSMAIDFGMQFKKRNGLWTPEGLPHLRGMNYEIEIAEESLHLLAPQPGDMLTNLGMAGWRLSAVNGDSLVFLDRLGAFYGRREEMKIVQRNGIPFHWPDCAEA